MSEQQSSKVFRQFGNRRRERWRQMDDQPEENRPDEPVAESQAMERTAQQPYRAAHIDKSRQQISLEVRFADGQTVRLFAWSFYSGAVSTTHKRLTLFFSNDVVTVKGRNLWKLIDAVRDNRLQKLVAFHPNQHLPPDEADAPYIEEIIYEDIHTATAGVKTTA